MRPRKRTGSPFLIMLAVLVLLLAGISAGCGGSTLEGSLAALHHGPGMDDVLLVLDGRIYSIPIEEGTPRPRLLYESWGWHRLMTAFVPFANHEDAEMILYTFRRQTIGGDFRPPIEIHSFTRQLPDGDLEHEVSFPHDGEPQEMMEEVLGTGVPLIPVMFRNQQLTFEHDNAWYRLTVDAVDIRGHHGFRYTFHMEEMGANDVEPGVSISGYDSVVVDERIAIWHPDGWHEEERREVELIVGDALVCLDEVFDPGYRLPWTITVSDRGEDQLLRYRPDGTLYSCYSPQARYAFVGPGPPSTEWLRHELTHALHIHALLERGMSLHAVSAWVFEGLAMCFQIPPDRLVHYDYPKLFRSDGVTLHWFNPVSFDPDSIRDLLTSGTPLLGQYFLGRCMILYLVEEFGFDRMMEYVLAVRSHAGNDPEREDDVTREFFGMTQAEILRAALEEPVEVSERLLPDYVVSEWELLTDVSLNPSTPDVSPQGDRVAFMPGEGILIMVMDLDSGEVQTVLGEDQHEFVTMGTLSWFPCRERLMFNAGREGAERNLYAFIVGDPGTIQEVVVSDSTDSGGAVSPCGELVAFRSERTGISQLFLKDLATGEVTQLTDGPHPKYWPRWSPGGDRIAFESRCFSGEDNVSLLGIIDLETGDIAYHDLHPWYRTWAMSRPEWLCDDEILVPVLVDEVRSMISVNLLTGEEKMWGGMVQSLQRVIPIPGSGDEYLVRVWDVPRPHEAEEFAGGRSAYRRLMRVTFEEYGPE